MKIQLIKVIQNLIFAFNWILWILLNWISLLVVLLTFYKIYLTSGTFCKDHLCMSCTMHGIAVIEMW